MLAPTAGDSDPLPRGLMLRDAARGRGCPVSAAFPQSSKNKKSSSRAAERPPSGLNLVSVASREPHCRGGDRTGARDFERKDQKRQ